ncbi:MAG TPA: PIN domain-containing protein [Candidatus Thermoplasmatota archaeon]
MPFVDASFFVALMDARDLWHEAARRAAPRLMRKSPWRTHTLALGEVIAVIGSRAGGRAARDAYDAIRDTTDVWAPTVAELDAAMPLVVRFDGSLSLSDALFVHAMEGEPHATILSFDDDFDKAGVRRLPSPT